MLEKSVSKGEKVPGTRARRWLRSLMLLLLVLTLTLSVYISNPQLSSSLHLWSTRSWSTKSSNNTTISMSSVEPSKIGQYFVAYPHQYHFILDEPDQCQQRRPFLVLMIPVAPQNRAARDAIRKTWARETTVLGRVVSHYFFLGLAKEGDGAETLQEQVLQESREHHDLLQSDFLDTYQNLTIKTMVMLEWVASRCPGVPYGMKIDSDMFLNVRNLVQMLQKAPQHTYITGMVARGAPVVRDPNSKWFLPEEVFPDSHYPPYALGLGYVFTLDLAKKFIEASKHVKAVYIEDVYLGLCLRYMGINPTDPPNGGLFKASMPYIWSSCYWTRVITTILNSPQQLLDVWQSYQTKAQTGCYTLFSP
uniref:beta-1,3-galactosyltransferase 1-like n=1 Tax=Centroberyx gerrardi TaxID=166262 RepID=UPI003AB07944